MRHFFLTVFERLAFLFLPIYKEKKIQILQKFDTI